MWKEISGSHCRTLQYGDDCILVHIIKTGYTDLYLIVEEDGLDMSVSSQEVIMLTKDEIFVKYGVQL